MQKNKYFLKLKKIKKFSKKSLKIFFDLKILQYIFKIKCSEKIKTVDKLGK